MKKLVRVVFVLALFLTVPACWAQDASSAPLPPPPTAEKVVVSSTTTVSTTSTVVKAPIVPTGGNPWSNVFNLGADLVRKIGAGDVVAALALLLNILANLIKMEWFQKWIARVVAKGKSWKMSPRGKVLLVTFGGLAIVYIFAPKSWTWYKILVKGIVGAFAAMGFHDFWQYVLKGETHESKVNGKNGNGHVTTEPASEPSA